MIKKEAIIITSAVGVALLALGYLHRELIQRNIRKLKTNILKKSLHTPASSMEVPQEKVS